MISQHYTTHTHTPRIHFTTAVLLCNKCESSQTEICVYINQILRPHVQTHVNDSKYECMKIPNNNLQNIHMHKKCFFLNHLNSCTWNITLKKYLCNTDFNDIQTIKLYFTQYCQYSLVLLYFAYENSSKQSCNRTTAQQNIA